MGQIPLRRKIQPTPKKQHQEPMQNQGNNSSPDPIITKINTQPISSSMPSQENPICSTSQDFDVLMDEDMGDLDLGELDLLGLEDACKKHAFHTIAPK
jgi:hypothetical protein